MKYILYVDTGFVGANHEEEIDIDDDEVNRMSKEELNNYLEEQAREYMHNCIEYGWREVKE